MFLSKLNKRIKNNLNTTKYSIILLVLFISINSYANNPTNSQPINQQQTNINNPQDNARYNAAKKIAEIANQIKNDSVEKIGIRNHYENRYYVKRNVQDTLLGELKGCYFVFMNRNLTDNEKNHFQINKIDFANPNPNFKINIPKEREIKEQQTMCMSLIQNPIKMSCTEEYVDANPYKVKVPNFKGPLANTEDFLNHLPYPKEDDPIMYKDASGAKLKVLNHCFLNEDLKRKNIKTSFESYFMEARPIGKLTPYIDPIYKDKEMYQIDIEYIPITGKELKTAKITTITIRPQDLTFGERLKEFIQEILLAVGVIGFLIAFFKATTGGIL